MTCQFFITEQKGGESEYSNIYIHILPTACGKVAN